MILVLHNGQYIYTYTINIHNLSNHISTAKAAELLAEIHHVSKAAALLYFRVF